MTGSPSTRSTRRATRTLRHTDRGRRRPDGAQEQARESFEICRLYDVPFISFAHKLVLTSSTASASSRPSVNLHDIAIIAFACYYTDHRVADESARTPRLLMNEPRRFGGRQISRYNQTGRFCCRFAADAAESNNRLNLTLW